jgi:hypothetical protein
VDTDPPIQPAMVEDGMGMEFDFDPGFNDIGNSRIDAPMSPHPDPQASDVPRKVTNFVYVYSRFSDSPPFSLYQTQIKVAFLYSVTHVTLTPKPENRPPYSQRTSPIPVSPPPSITENFSQLIITHDHEQRSDITNVSKEKPITKRTKRTRLLLDARTELTDEELKVRHYLDTFGSSTLT